MLHGKCLRLSVSHHASVFAFREDRLGKGALPPLHPPESEPSQPSACRRPAAMSEARPERAKDTAPWRGRPRVTDAKGCFIAIRCTVKQHEVIKEGAAKAGLSVGAYLRALALRYPGPRSVRRPLPGQAELVRLLGHIGKIGSNVNQIAKIANTYRRPPGKSALYANWQRRRSASHLVQRRRGSRRPACRYASRGQPRGHHDAGVQRGPQSRRHPHRQKRQRGIAPARSHRVAPGEEHQARQPMPARVKVRSGPGKPVRVKTATRRACP